MSTKIQGIIKFVLASMLGGLLVLLFVNLMANKKPPSYDPVKFYNHSGPLVVGKIFMDTVTATTGNALSVDISSAGFSTVYGAVGIPIKNTTSFTTMPMCHVKTLSNTAAVFNIVEQNSNTVNILGSLVLLGTPFEYANTTGLQMAVFVIGK